MISFGVFGSSFFSIDGALSDFGVDFSVKFLYGFNFSLSEVLFPLAELLGEVFIGLFFQNNHVFINVSSEDSFSVDFSVIGDIVSSLFVSWESLGVVGNIESSVACSFKGSEHFVSGGSGNQSQIKDSFEGSLSLDFLFSDLVVFSVSLGLSLVFGV